MSVAGQEAPRCLNTDTVDGRPCRLLLVGRRDGWSCNEHGDDIGWERPR